MSDQLLRVKTWLRIAKPPHEVYNAIVDPENMAQYFISWGSGRLDAGEVLNWKWNDAEAEFPITPQQMQSDRLISFLWSASGVEARVEFALEPDGQEATFVRVTETGWPADEPGIARCLDQMQGWMHMLCCLKAWLEYGINLRKGGIFSKVESSG